MAQQLAALIEAARALAPEDRFELVHQMLVSVDEPARDHADVDPAWKDEFRRRLDEIDSGKVGLLDGRETLRLARERIAERRASREA